MKNVNALVEEKNDMIKKGQIVEASEKFFGKDLKTMDHTGINTGNKAEMIEKMKGFAVAIRTVNGITLHYASNNDKVSFSEWTFDFDMVDGSKILWHEIIRSVWKDGEIVEEQYFKA